MKDNGNKTNHMVQGSYFSLMDLITLVLLLTDSLMEMAAISSAKAAITKAKFGTMLQKEKEHQLTISKIIHIQDNG